MSSLVVPPRTTGHVTSAIMPAALEPELDAELPLAVELVEALEPWPGPNRCFERGLPEPWCRLLADGARGSSCGNGMRSPCGPRSS
jgi:hypothetical protein